ncbi:MAG: hypothetical protein KatS3mg108_0207 [Isosphaeraceae bacterium]|jgi:hypothetical protein|nr:MAG: hypothetical protein KatS3mg108_0207 [Isosphaeraceae bacterium]
MMRRLIVDLVCLGIGAFLVSGAANLVMEEVGPTAQAGPVWYYCANKTPCPQTTWDGGCTCPTVNTHGNCQPFAVNLCSENPNQCSGRNFATGNPCSCAGGC